MENIPQVMIEKNDWQIQLEKQSAGITSFLIITPKKWKNIIIKPGERLEIRTDLRIKLPKNILAMMNSIDSSIITQGLIVLNSYSNDNFDGRNFWSIILINVGKSDVLITPETDVARLCFLTIPEINITTIEPKNETCKEKNPFNIESISKIFK